MEMMKLNPFLGPIKVTHRNSEIEMVISISIHLLLVSITNSRRLSKSGGIKKHMDKLDIYPYLGNMGFQVEIEPRRMLLIYAQ